MGGALRFAPPRGGVPERSATVTSLRASGVIALASGALGLAIGALGLASCGGGPDTEAARVAEAASELPVDLLKTSWPIVVDNPTVRAPFEAEEGWARLVVSHKLDQGAKRLDAAGGLGAARAHIEAATMFRQAAWMSAQAIIQTYGELARDTDPVAMSQLLMESYILAGDLDKARAEEARLTDVPPELAPWRTPWTTWLDAGAAWPPDLSTLPIGLPEPGSTSWPELDTAYHYQLREQVEDEQLIDVYDPGALVALAMWHDAAARAAAPDHVAALDVYEARYRYPVEGPVAARDDLPLELLFGSDFLVPADGAFLAAAIGSPDGPAAAITEYADKSALAAIAQRSLSDGKIDPQKVIDLSASVRTWMIDTLKTANGGNTQVYHRTFADQASVGVLRTVALIAEAEGQHENSGILRINALEHSTDEHTWCPSYLLSMAAWDAGNQYPLRATEIVHNLIRRFPSLETARFGIDALGLRVSRERGPANPGQ